MLKLKKLNSILAIQIIISMTLYYFVLIGYIAVSYAIDIVETNNHNVDFSAYFLNANGERIDSVEKFINEEEYLYIDVTVKNEGFFNGTISFNNNNFNIKQEMMGENVEQITGNEVKLKQINAGAKETIKLLIEPIKNNEISKNVFSGNTNINLNGQYANGKNIENNNFDSINGTTSVKVIWKSQELLESSLEADVLTNMIYEKEGQSNRIVQFLINSKLKNNEFPIGKNILNITVPEQVKDVKVFTRNTDATGSKIDFKADNFKYDKSAHLLNIKIENDDDNTIFWNKGIDTFIVTYIFDKDYDVTKDEIKIDNKIYTYDNKEIKNETSFKIVEEKDGTITNDLVLNESSIFKGKVYTGEEREYKTTSKIYINNKDLVNKISFINDESKYLQNEEIINANVLYKSVSINKKEFLKTFGESGFITVKDESGATVGNISNSSQEDENGNVVLNFGIGKKKLSFETSKPIAEGTLNLENIKIIQNNELQRDKVSNLTGLKETFVANYNAKAENVTTDKMIELKNTISKAKLELGKDVISSKQRDEQLEIIAVLNTMGEDNSLFKNPVIEILLPKEMDNVSINQANILYKNGLTIQSSEVIKKEDGRYAVIIKCDGEQEKYSKNEETELHIYIGQRVKDLEEDNIATIEMNCFNENDSMSIRTEKNITLEKNKETSTTEVKQTENVKKETGEEIQETSKDEPKEILYEVSAIKGAKELTEDDPVYEQETVKYKLTIKNNTDEDYENISVKAIQQNGKMWKNVPTEEYNPCYGSTELENYYKLTDSSEMEFDKIEKLKSGASIELVFDSTADFLDDENEKKLYSNITIISDDRKIEKEIKTIENRIKKANIDIKIEPIEAEEISLYEDMFFPNQIIISNHDEKKLENVIIKVLYSKNLIFDEETPIGSLDGSDNFSIESINKNSKGETFVTLKISEINGNSNFGLVTKPKIGDIKESKEEIKILAQVTLNESEVYYSNYLVRYSKNVEKNIQIVQKVYLEGQEISESFEVANESIIKIETTITNGNSEDTKILAENMLQDGLEFEKAYLVAEDGKIEHQIDKNQTDEYVESEEQNKIEFKNEIVSLTEEIKSGKSLLFDIEARVNTDEILEKAIENELNVTDLKSIISYSKKILINTDKRDTEEEEEEEHEIETEEPDEMEEEFSENYGYEEDDDEKSNDENKNRKINGIAWLDKNKNGMRDEDEQTIEGINVKVKDMSTSEISKVSVSTNKDGKYELSAPKGRYMLLFEFESDKYKLTTYQMKGVSQEFNSDVILKEIEIDGEKRNIAVTDEIIVEEDVSNIDIGLIEKEKFDLKLNKYISKISISNNQGNKSIEYDDAELAKVEIKAKYLSGTTVAMEYKIKVTNEGDIPGFAKQIVDYMPQDLEFNSSINPGWYQNGNDIYNDTLKDTLIKPGETKEVTLVLTKAMTENNIGLINNMAEIFKDYNDEKASDINSTTGNKQKNENDLGQANVIISVSTGALINYLLITFTISGLVTVLSIYVGKKYLNKLQ